jgi:hypothetical protein
MSKTLSDLRAALFDTLDKVKSGELELDKARTINDIGKTLVDTAKVEVQYLEVVEDVGESAFIAPTSRQDLAPLPNGIAGITRHILKD